MVTQGKIEDQRAEAERELAEQRAQDEALQAYLDQMSTLILNRNLLESEQGSPTYTLAQPRTATVMARLDAPRNRSVVRFLYDSGLAGSLLRGITLEGADLRDADLISFDLNDAELGDADLSDALLQNADLSDADLTNADLDGVILQEPPRSDPWNHSVAILHGADLTGAFITQENLEKLAQTQSLDGATMPNGQKYEESSSTCLAAAVRIADSSGPMG